MWHKTSTRRNFGGKSQGDGSMNFEVILHGKPYSGSHKVSNGLDKTFCQNLVDKFFQSKGNIKESETLIVDTRNWKGKWYSVYTFWHGHNGNIVDTADRPSFIAISMILPNQYVCLVSAAFDLLKKAYQEHVVGTYISKSGKYIVQDLDDEMAFNKLYTFLGNDFVNLCENFDNSFKQISESISNSYYNLLDCDSKAFVEDLKKHGRVFVSEIYESKDSRLTNTDKYLKELQKAQNDLSEKDKQITQLSNDIKGLNDQINNKNTSTSKTINEQKEQLETLNKTITGLKTSIEKYQGNEQKIQEILGASVKETPIIEEETQKPKHSSRVENLIPIVNMLLLVVLFVISCFNSCGPNAMDSDNSSEELHREIDSLKGIIEEKDGQINTLSCSIGNVALETQNDDTATDNGYDRDCHLSFVQDNQLVSREKIDKNKPLTIIVKDAIEGYDFYTDNLDAKVSSGTKFALKKKNANKAITIVYRSSDRSKRNDANVLIIK